MPNKIFIYGLVDPRNSKIRYVGKTGRTTKRLWEHIRHCKEHTKKGCWIKKLVSMGMRPRIKVLETVEESKWKHREKFWIKKLSKNSNLTNLTKGGDEPCLHYMRSVAKVDIATGVIIEKYVSVSEAARKNKFKSESRIFDSCSGKVNYSKGFLWRYLDNKGNIIKVNRTKGRTVVKIDYNTMKILQAFPTVYDVRKAGYGVANVHKVCNGLFRSAYGYIWRYKNDFGIIEPIIKYKFKMVNKLSLDGVFIQRYENTQQAAHALNIDNPRLILKACRTGSAAYGYKWQFHIF